MDNIKLFIRVKNPKDSENIQTLMLSLGFCWGGSLSKDIKNLDSKYLVFKLDGKKMLTRGSKPAAHDKIHFKYIEIDNIIDLEHYFKCDIVPAELFTL